MAQLAKILEISQELTVRNEWEQIYSDKGMLQQLRLNRRLSSYEEVNWDVFKQDPVRKYELFKALLILVEEDEKIQILKDSQQGLPLLSVQNFRVQLDKTGHVHIIAEGKPCRLRKHALSRQSEYGENLDHLIDDICRCLQMERQLIWRVANEPSTPLDQSSVEAYQISDDYLKCVESMMHLLCGQLTELKSKTDNKAVLFNLGAFDHATDMLHNTNVDNTSIQSQAQIQDTGMFTDLVSRWETLLSPVQDIWSRLILACDACNEELANWKSLQKQHYISPGAEEPQKILNSISGRCSRTGLLLWQFLRMIQDILALAAGNVGSTVIEATVQEVLRYIRSLLQSSFVVTVQPKPFTLTSKKRKFGLRILAAESLRIGPLKATAELVPETALNKMKESQSQVQIKALVTMEAEISCLSTLSEPKEFSMEMKRENTKGSKKVWEDMHRIRFWVEIRLLDSVPISLEMFSLPFAIVSAANQIVDGHGAVFWRLCAQNDIETSFDMPDSLPWSVISTALSDKFLHQTGRGLEEHQLRHLASRLNLTAEEKDTDGNIIGERLVIRDHFYKKSIEDKELTFWKWYYAACNLLVTAQSLLEPWREKLIYGFLGRITSEQLLESQPNGTFLIRFSDSMVSDPKSNHITGLLATSSIQDRSISEYESKFCHCEPYAVEGFSKKSIGQLLIETDFSRPNLPKPFRFLYPEGRNCEEAFSKYIKATPDILKKLHYIPFKTKDEIDTCTALSHLELDSDNVKGQRNMQAKELLYPWVANKCNPDLIANDEHKPIKRKRISDHSAHFVSDSNVTQSLVKDSKFNAEDFAVKIPNKPLKNHFAQSSQIFHNSNCGFLMTNNEDLCEGVNQPNSTVDIMDILNPSFNDASNLPLNDNSTGPAIMEQDRHASLSHANQFILGADPMLSNVEGYASGQNVPNVVPDESDEFINTLASFDGTDV